ncbi:MAG: hypothetical protein NTW17_01300 [Candidatus Pacearchaeota archaeon]|nr:hypothetical protein [Candidatus Pacearchaeota archaeon]
MVYQIMNSKYRVFLETLILTLLILFLGFLLGMYIESSRTGKIIADYKNFEIGVLDLKLQNYYYQIMNKASCDVAIEQNFIFADKLYEEGLTIEKYEQGNKLTDDILLEKKRYVLLKTELWLNSILLKEKCKNPFHTVVYVYAQESNVLKDAEQRAISATLEGIKEEQGNKIVLIPIAGDLGLDAVSMQLKIYNVTYLPSVIIDEKYVIEGFAPEADFKKYLN